ncbi:LOW QUALITY PROTEIN: 23 kDa integral membrane protein-like, partial [Sycon ciliatum]|uniref:LOW QUALITY PROTEIN: 23 kDa integral membrane protein-like n=1 Tax=Sycon ciliatum TaxID=27933 RepID=UPI0031F6E7A4
TPLFNFLFFILGFMIVVLGFGIYARIKQGDYDSALVIIDAGTSQWESFGSLCIAVGVFIALLGGPGCIGAGKEHRDCLVFFTILVALIFIPEVAAGGLGHHYRGKLDDKINMNLNKTLNEYVDDQKMSVNGSKIITSWDNVQHTFKCCAIHGPADYKNRGGTTPASCNADKDTIKGLYQQGCKEKVFDAFTDHWKEWAGAVVGIAVVQLLAIVFALLLIREMGRGDSYTVVLRAISAR